MMRTVDRCVFFSLCLQVQPKHVKEAFRLLNKSIIRVETPDINLEQEDELEEEEEQQEDGTDTQTRTRSCRQMYINLRCTEKANQFVITFYLMKTRLCRKRRP